MDYMGIGSQQKRSRFGSGLCPVTWQNVMWTVQNRDGRNECHRYQVHVSYSLSISLLMLYFLSAAQIAQIAQPI